MADKTISFKIEDEFEERTKNLIEASGLTAKDWFKKTVALAEVQSIKEGASDFNQDLTELEAHTTRVYELIANMIQRSIYLKESAIKEYADKVDQKELILSEYIQKHKIATEESKAAHATLEELQEEMVTLEGQLEETRSANENNKALINEYKEKIDTLSGLISKYQAFADENEQLKIKFSNEKEKLESQVKEVTFQNNTQTEEIIELQRKIEEIKRNSERDIEDLKRNHESEMERITEKKDYEKDRALLELEKDHQNQISELKEKHNKEIKNLYNEMAALRKEFEEKLENERIRFEIKEKNVNNLDEIDKGE